MTDNASEPNDGKEEREVKIFDFHLHPGYDFHNDELGYEITPERFIAGLDRYGVTFCAGSSIHKADNHRPLEEYEEAVPRLNREAYAFFERYPDRFTPGIHIHPDFVELSCREVTEYADKGVRLVGELVPSMMEWRRYKNPHLVEILRVASERGMVLSMHPTTPEDMEWLFAELPDMQIVVAHLSAYGLYEWSLEMMKKYKNVHYDISAHGTDPQMLRSTVDLLGAERILYGTDYPGYDPSPFIRAVRESGLTDGEQENIFYKNAERLLGIRIPD